MCLLRFFQGFTVQANATIAAPIEQVWTILVDLEHYAEWNTFVPSMRSSLQVGSLLTMIVRFRKHVYIKIAETVTVVEPQHQLAWQARYPAWFLHSERFQTIRALDANTTLYETHETFTGLMVPVLKLLLGRSLQGKFKDIARDLKNRAEMLRAS